LPFTNKIFLLLQLKTKLMSKKGSYDSPFRATLKGITDLYAKKVESVTLPTQIDLTGKTVLITGSSSGLGFAAAKRMAAAGAEVIMAVRSGIPAKGQQISELTSNSKVTMYHVDLLDFESIRKLIDGLLKDEKKLDLLVSNAAMVPLKSRRTPQGLEEMFMVNYLAPFYLINQIVGQGILKRRGSRIIIVSSESHRNPKAFDWENFGKYHEYGINETVSRYGYFKLLLTTFGNELNRRLQKEGMRVAVRILCPGPVNSNIAREAPGWMQPLLKGVFSLFFKSPEKASDPILYFAGEYDSSDPIPYLFLMQKKVMDDKALDPQNGEHLWQLSEKLISQLVS
jgi:NAD(P)-dependent dehydrogenase (short-subunit alcohol dehydrogenase family)